MLRIESVREQDFLEIDPPVEPTERLTLMQWVKMGPAFTGFLPDGKILGVAGIAIVSPNYGHAWLIASQYVEKYPKLFNRTVVSFLREIIESKHLTYIQAIVDPKVSRNCRWIERLGFSLERYLYVLKPGDNHGT